MLWATSSRLGLAVLPIFLIFAVLALLAIYIHLRPARSKGRWQRQHDTPEPPSPGERGAIHSPQSDPSAGNRETRSSSSRMNILRDDAWLRHDSSTPWQQLLRSMPGLVAKPMVSVDTLTKDAELGRFFAAAVADAQPVGREEQGVARAEMVSETSGLVSRAANAAELSWPAMQSDEPGRMDASSLQSCPVPSVAEVRAEPTESGCEAPPSRASHLVPPCLRKEMHAEAQQQPRAHVQSKGRHPSPRDTGKWDAVRAQQEWLIVELSRAQMRDQVNNLAFGDASSPGAEPRTIYLASEC